MIVAAGYHSNDEDNGGKAAPTCCLVLQALCTLFYLILTTTLRGRLLGSERHSSRRCITRPLRLAGRDAACIHSLPGSPKPSMRQLLHTPTAQCVLY